MNGPYGKYWILRVTMSGKFLRRTCVHLYAVSEVAERLGICTKSLYTWRAQFSKPAKEVKIDTGQTREIQRLKAELARVTEERDILKKATVYFARDAK